MEMERIDQMRLLEHEALRVNLIMLGANMLSSSQQVEAFSASVDSEVERTGTGITFMRDQSIPTPNIRLELPKDRIALELEANRAIIERAYPSRDDLLRLAEVATLAADNSELGDALPTAHGYNVEMVYRLESGASAYAYLGQHLFGEGEDALAAPNWNAVGGAARKTYGSPEGRWEFTIEPRFRASDTDKVFLSLNLHKEQPGVPSQEIIATSLELVWNQARALMGRLGTRARA